MNISATGLGLTAADLPGLETDQSVLDSLLVVLGHVLVHIRVVLADVALRAAVRDCPEAEWGGIGVRRLELEGEKTEEVNNQSDSSGKI